MEPSINDGDMVLIDQSGTSLNPHGIFAVGFEETLYIKRVEQRSGYIILHSDNPDYSDISARQWLASNPAQIVADHLNVTTAFVESLPTDAEPAPVIWYDQSKIAK